MIKIFSPTDRVFTSNGDIVIEATRANVHKVDNGDYYLELTCDNKYSDYIKANNIVVAPTPTGEQAFRLEAAIESSGTKIKAKAWHVYYDSENYVISDSYVVEKNCQAALEHINAATDTTSPFSVSSNVSHIDSYRCVRKSLREAFATVLERWGGHIVRDNYNVSIRNTIGQDNGVTIQYKKNLKAITVKEDWSAVCTKVLPVGQEGILLEELYLYAPTQYSIPYTKVVSFDQNINREEYETEAEYIAAVRADLREKATAYLEVAQYPTINYKISANMEKITDVGDLVEVYDERLNVSLAAAVISFDYDAITGRYTQVQFGTLGASLSNLFGSINSDISASIAKYTQDITSYLDVAVEVATAEIWQALGGGYCIIAGDSILVVDTLPVEISTYAMKIDKNGISFSSTGALGAYTNVWSLENVLKAQNINIVGLTLNKITGGILTLGGVEDANGSIEIKSAAGATLGTIDHNGFSVNVSDGSTIFLDSNGFRVLDSYNNEVFGISNGITSAKSLKVNTVDILDAIRYKSGNTYSATARTVGGYIGSNTLSFSLELPKSLAYISTVSVSDLKANVRTVAGAFLFGSFVSGGYNVLSDSTLSVAVSKGDGFITVTVTKSSNWSATANTPVSVTLESIGLSFS